MQDGEREGPDNVNDGEDLANDDVELDDPGAVGTGQSWARLISLLAAFTFLGGAIGYYLTTPKPPGDTTVDVGFYRDMITHHDQAVEMALLELANGENPLVTGFAREVVIFQRREIGRMEEALLRWGVTGERSDTAMTWMSMPVPVTAMPGLATTEQMDALRAARGAEADALFLDLMAEHHRGGVHMAQYAAENASDPLVRGLAETMRRNQSIEINEYRATVEQLGLDIDIDPYVEGDDPFAQGQEPSSEGS